MHRSERASVLKRFIVFYSRGDKEIASESMFLVQSCKTGMHFGYSEIMKTKSASTMNKKCMRNCIVMTFIRVVHIIAWKILMESIKLEKLGAGVYKRTTQGETKEIFMPVYQRLLNPWRCFFIRRKK